MDVDLKLLIVDGRMTYGGYAHTMMEFGRYYELFDALNKVAKMIPDFELNSYVARLGNGGHGYGPVTETPYGQPLTFVTAAEFLSVMSGMRLDYCFALAAVAYVRELTADTLIGLYYH